MSQPIKIACIGNYPPRECGIATFTRDLLASINGHQDQKSSDESFIVAINDEGCAYDYPDQVKTTIRQNHQRDYLKAAQFINASGADVCLLEHEFGIFGGMSGLYILSLISELKIPVVTTLHTVLKNPSYHEKRIIKVIAKVSQKLVVMSNPAVEFLVRIYGIPKNKIELIPHGAPECDLSLGRQNRKKLGFENRKILLTFGLISRNKGIETVINALPQVVKKYPNLLYVILGATHPNVVKISGEEYRNFLHRLVKQKKIEKNVVFYDHFVSNEKLFEYLTALDIYITPYLNKDQITSGTLAYAIGAGAASVSTPYWHAEDLLSDGRGRLFDFGNHDQLSQILLELLDNPEELNRIRKRAYAYGKKTFWPYVGKAYLSLLQKEKSNYSKIKPTLAKINPQELPSFSLDHVECLTDHMGILQHAKYNVPNKREGYCLDDNARALMMITMAYRQKRSPVAKKLFPIYFSFIDYMQKDDGSFHNFLSITGQYLDKVGSEDAFSRTLWSLGYFIRFSLIDSYSQLAQQLFDKALPYIQNLKTIRGKANTVIAISNYLFRFSGNELIRKLLKELTDQITKQYELESDNQWRWYEPVLAYDNAILPLSLFYAYRVTSDEKHLQIATETMEFLDRLIFNENHPSIIGNETWYRKGKSRSQYAQQPIDVMALVLLYRQAHFIFNKTKYLRKMFSCFNWFLGENDLRLPLYDPETKGCNDGLEKYGVNRNQGAESTLCYLIAHLSILTVDELTILKEA